MMRLSWLVAALSVMPSPTLASGRDDNPDKEAWDAATAKVKPAVLDCFQVSSPVLSSKGLVDGTGWLGTSTDGKQPESSCQEMLMEYSFQNSHGHPFVGRFEAKLYTIIPITGHN